PMAAAQPSTAPGTLLLSTYSFLKSSGLLVRVMERSARLLPCTPPARPQRVRAEGRVRACVSVLLAACSRARLHGAHAPQPAASRCAHKKKPRRRRTSAPLTISIQ